MKLESVQSDVKAQEEGEWGPHPYFDGIDILCISPQSTAVKARRKALLNRRPQRRMKTGDAIEAGDQVESLCTAECLRDVKGFDDVTYSLELGREWAIDPKMRRFMDGVREFADEIGVREQAVHEESLSD